MSITLLPVSGNPALSASTAVFAVTRIVSCELTLQLSSFKILGMGQRVTNIEKENMAWLLTFKILGGGPYALENEKHNDVGLF